MLNSEKLKYFAQHITVKKSAAMDKYTILKEDLMMKEFMQDLWGFLKVRKKFWLAPIILTMLILGVLIILSQNAAVAPFIYTVF